MKNITLLIAGFFMLGLFAACDPGAVSTTTIENKSSYDLHIVFMIKENVYTRINDYQDIDVKKGGLASFTLGSMGGYRNPNNEIESIFFLDMNSGKILGKVLIDESYNISFVGARKKGLSNYGDFSTTINDTLLNGPQNTIEERLVKDAFEHNKTLPAMLNSETRLDSVAALSGNKCRFIYSYINIVRGEIDTETFTEERESDMLNVFGPGSNAKFFRDNNVTVIYQCLDKNGREITSIELTPDDYK